MGERVLDLRVDDLQGVEIVLFEGHRRWAWTVTELGNRSWPCQSENTAEWIRTTALLNRLDTDVDAHIGARVRVLDPLVAADSIIPGLRQATHSASDAVLNLVRRGHDGDLLSEAELSQVMTTLEALKRIECDELLPRIQELVPPTTQVALRERFLDARSRHPRRPMTTASVRWA